MTKRYATHRNIYFARLLAGVPYVYEREPMSDDERAKLAARLAAYQAIVGDSLMHLEYVVR